MDPKVQRHCWFDTIPAHGYRWKYKRAIEGHKLVLDKVMLIAEQWAILSDQVFQIYDGHTYSHWGSYPNIFDQATLGIASLNQNMPSYTIYLDNWECKEVTMSWHNTHVENNVRNVAILYFYETPMSKLEMFEYAVRQPRYKYRHGGPITLSRFED
ncbi:hypothetical protein ES703_95060 [subsurface metagenome]